MKTLVIVDMQNDFIDGSLKNDKAKAIIPDLCEFIKVFDGNIICTLDTHGVNYLASTEGYYLPVEHCIKGSAGWTLNSDIYNALRERQRKMLLAADASDSNSAEETQKVLFKSEPIFIEKPTFGFLNWRDVRLDGTVVDEKIDEIILVGTCTDICVISNALILKATYPNIRISVMPSLCAGLTEEKHKAAVEVMSSCQIEIK